MAGFTFGTLTPQQFRSYPVACDHVVVGSKETDHKARSPICQPRFHKARNRQGGPYPASKIKRFYPYQETRIRVQKPLDLTLSRVIARAAPTTPFAHRTRRQAAIASRRP